MDKVVYREGSRRPIKDIAGQRFGKLTVLGLGKIPDHDRYNRVWWECRCDCGKTKTVLSNDLKLGKVKSCGCMRGQRREYHREPAPVSRIIIDRTHFDDDWMFQEQGGKTLVKAFRTKEGDWI